MSRERFNSERGINWYKYACHLEGEVAELKKRIHRVLVLDTYDVIEETYGDTPEDVLSFVREILNPSPELKTPQP